MRLGSPSNLIYFISVFVDDLASAIVQADAQMSTHHGKIFEIGGPNVYTYKQLMQLTLDQAGKQRLLLPLPWIVGEIQGLVLQQLPPNLFSLTRDQVWLLKQDNIVTPGALTLQDLGVIHPSSAESQLGYLKK